MAPRKTPKTFSTAVYGVELIAARVAREARVGAGGAACKTLPAAAAQAANALKKTRKHGLSPRHSARLLLAKCQLRNALRAAQLRCHGKTYRDDMKLEAALDRYNACAKKAGRKPVVASW